MILTPPGAGPRFDVSTGSLGPDTTYVPQFVAAERPDGPPRLVLAVWRGHRDDGYPAQVGGHLLADPAECWAALSSFLGSPHLPDVSRAALALVSHRPVGRPDVVEQGFDPAAAVHCFAHLVGEATRWVHLPADGFALMEWVRR